MNIKEQVGAGNESWEEIETIAEDCLKKKIEVRSENVYSVDCTGLKRKKRDRENYQKIGLWQRLWDGTKQMEKGGKGMRRTNIHNQIFQWVYIWKKELPKMINDIRKAYSWEALELEQKKKVRGTWKKGKI